MTTPRFLMTFANGWTTRTYDSLEAALAAARKLCPDGAVTHRVGLVETWAFVGGEIVRV